MYIYIYILETTRSLSRALRSILIGLGPTGLSLRLDGPGWALLFDGPNGQVTSWPLCAHMHPPLF